jgi:hypothetical protein
MKKPLSQAFGEKVLDTWEERNRMRGFLGAVLAIVFAIERFGSP